MYETVSQTSHTSLTYYTVQSLSSDISGPHPLPNHATFQPSDPNVISPAVQPLRNEGVASASHGSLNNILVGQMSLGKLFNKKKKKSKVKESVWCNTCKIECNNIQDYERHVSGKKHNKIIKNIYASTIVSAQQSSQSGNNTTGSGTSVGEGKPVVPNVLADLESKKRKLLEGGTPAQCLRVCAICNVACNGKFAFSEHLAGKKHIAQGKEVKRLILHAHAEAPASCLCL